MTNKQLATFPFEFIVLWIRPRTIGHPTCMFCGESTAHVMYPFVGLLPQVLSGGLIDMDAEWSKAIQKQMRGEYEAPYYQPVCDECVQTFATIQLGKRRPIQHLLTLASIARKQQNIDFSLVICCTVKSLSDEGDTWAMNAPDTTIEDVAKHVRSGRVK